MPNKPVRRFQFVYILEQRCIDFVDIVVAVCDVELDYEVEHIAVGQRQTDGLKQQLGLIEAQLQRNGKRKHRGLAGLVLGVIVYLPEGALADISLLVALYIAHTLFVD